MTFSPKQREFIFKAISDCRRMDYPHLSKRIDELRSILLMDMNVFYQEVDKPLSDKYANLKSVLDIPNVNYDTLHLIYHSFSSVFFNYEHHDSIFELLKYFSIEQRSKDYACYVLDDPCVWDANNEKFMEILDELRQVLILTLKNNIINVSKYTDVADLYTRINYIPSVKPVEKQMIIDVYRSTFDTIKEYLSRFTDCELSANDLLPRRTRQDERTVFEYLCKEDLQSDVSRFRILNYKEINDKFYYDLPEDVDIPTSVYIYISGGLNDFQDIVRKEIYEIYENWHWRELRSLSLSYINYPQLRNLDIFKAFAEITQKQMTKLGPNLKFKPGIWKDLNDIYGHDMTKNFDRFKDLIGIHTQFVNKKEIATISIDDWNKFLKFMNPEPIETTISTESTSNITIPSYETKLYRSGCYMIQRTGDSILKRVKIGKAQDLIQRINGEMAYKNCTIISINHIDYYKITACENEIKDKFNTRFKVIREADEGLTGTETYEIDDLIEAKKLFDEICEKYFT